MIYQRKKKTLQVIGLLVFLLILVYLFSALSSMHPFVDKLKGLDNNYMPQEAITGTGNIKHGKTFLLNNNSKSHGIRMVRDPVGVFLKDADVRSNQGNYERSSSFLKSLTEKFFGKFSLSHRIVHIDLKGAPPKMDYLLSIMPLLQNLGATGLLIEYEDMFPYSGEIEKLSAHNAYKISEIRSLLQMAKELNMEIIPLIQTFGHLEFALKLQEFSHLREVPNYPQVICPVRNGSVPILTKMIDQVIALHHEINWLHIGSDEVYNIGECHQCQEYMFKNKLDKDSLFLAHALKVAKYVRNSFDIQPIMWDDEFRKITQEDIMHSEIGKYVEIMVWHYSQGILANIGNDIWEKYSKSFDGVWVASAFKGAAKPDSFITDINERLNNNKEWMEVVDLYKSGIQFRGITLTGWQRFDHFAVLCELLPQGIPSLAVSLMYIMNQKTDHAALSSVGDALECNTFLNLDLKYLEYVNTCRFPGAKLYEIAQRLYTLNNDVDSMMKSNYMTGWVEKYNIDKNFGSPQMVEQGLQDLPMLLHEYKRMFTDARKALSEVYDEHTVNEWIAINLEENAQKLNDLYKARSQLLKNTYWPRRPLDSTANNEL